MTNIYGFASLLADQTFLLSTLSFRARDGEVRMTATQAIS